MTIALRAPAGPIAAGRSDDPVRVAAPLMGGEVSVHVVDPGAGQATVEARATRILGRIGAWAGHLTRFDPGSDLGRLNGAAGSSVTVGPTVAAVLDWARDAERMSNALVDVTMLDARIAAETGADPARTILGNGRGWSIERAGRSAVVRREPGVRFDLDGVAKGWIADRALALTAGRSAIVDGDGDVAVRVARGDRWEVEVADPRSPGTPLAVLELTSAASAVRGFGIATSGTSVHRWRHDAGETHHVIDPRTLRPAASGVVQATVLAGSAREAEVLAKVALILGGDAAFPELDRCGALGLLLLDDGEVRASRGLVRWLV